MGGSYFDMRSFDETATESSRSKEIRKTNVLIIDDSILVVNQLTKILENNDILISGVSSNGTDAINTFGEKLSQIDLILLDDSIRGEMDSLSILKRILELNHSASVIMICRMGREEHGKQAVEIGSKGCIIKPLEEGIVLNTLQKVLDSDQKLVLQRN